MDFFGHFIFIRIEFINARKVINNGNEGNSISSRNRHRLRGRLHWSEIHSIHRQMTQDSEKREGLLTHSQSVLWIVRERGFRAQLVFILVDGDRRERSLSVIFLSWWPIFSFDLINARGSWGRDTSIIRDRRTTSSKSVCWVRAQALQRRKSVGNYRALVRPSV